MRLHRPRINRERWQQSRGLLAYACIGVLGGFCGILYFALTGKMWLALGGLAWLIKCAALAAWLGLGEDDHRERFPTYEVGTTHELDLGQLPTYKHKD